MGRPEDSCNHPGGGDLEGVPRWGVPDGGVPDGGAEMKVLVKVLVTGKPRSGPEGHW